MKTALIVANTFGLITKFLDNDLTILRDMGFEIECACNTNYSDFDVDGFFDNYSVKVHHVDFPIRDINIGETRKSAAQLRVIISEHTYCLVHSHTTIASVIVRNVIKGASYKPVVVYTSHGFPFYKGCNRLKGFVFQQIETYYSRYTDAVITICNEDYKNAQEMKCRKVFKINGVGIDSSFFDAACYDRATYRAKLGFSPKDIVILSVGELNSNKNHQILIRAISELNDPRYTLAVCGREVTELGKMDELTRLANGLGVRVVFLGYRRDIRAVCQSADVGAIPSFKEGLGLSGLEMLATGLPVVGSARQGIMDYIIDGVTGFLCDPTSASSFAEGIVKARHLSLSRGFSEKAKSVALDYRKEEVYEALLGIYTELLSEKGLVS